MRPNCECCDRDLAPGEPAYICSFECTWCADCVTRFPGGACPNCGGELSARPSRRGGALERNPASTTRVVSAECADGVA